MQVVILFIIKFSIFFFLFYFSSFFICIFRHEFENDNKWSAKEKNKLKTLSICKDINRILLNVLSPKIQHLNESEVDIEPRHEAFWFVGGIDPIKLVQKIRRGQKMSEEEIMAPVDRNFQYISK